MCVPQSGTIFIMVSQGDKMHQAVFIEARCRLVASILSSKQGGFRLSIAFTKILNDGKQVLGMLLKEKHPVSDSKT